MDEAPVQKPDSCPECGSNRSITQQCRWGFDIQQRTILVMPFRPARWQCNDCLHTWIVSDTDSETYEEI